MSKRFGLVVGIVTLVAGLGIATPAYANDTCKEVTIKVTNKLKKKVQIVDISWFDFDKEKWRDPYELKSEVKVIQPGESRTYLKNLTGVKKDKTKVKVEYQKRKDGVIDSWEGEYKVVGEPHKCKDNEINELVIE